MVSRSIEGAQKKVEGRNFDIRRHVLQYDDVMNKHRDIVYKRRQKVLEKIAETPSPAAATAVPSPTGGEGGNPNSLPLHEEVLAALRREVHGMVDAHARSDDPEEWDIKMISESVGALHGDFQKEFSVERIKTFTDPEALKDQMTMLVHRFYKEKCDAADPALTGRAESIVTLRSIDTHWMDHIDDMSHLREQVAFSGYAQRDPLIEYQDQGFRRFQALIQTIDSTIVRTLLQSDFAMFAPQATLEFDEEEREADLRTNEADIEGSLTGGGGGTTLQLSSEEAKQIPFNMQAKTPSSKPQAPSRQQRSIPEVGRNDPCPCGSGKKFKKCHGKNS
jgi:preprotein translocase subunit SecA